ncbi:DUF1993 domain-containing protein [Burkholderia ubonensis]|uniref:DUF1993 family protein n=1 Tax=Burkholderia ubonensis TaxID=101571 RepID=UPI00075EC1AB|nr:DUF1993 domain-containing protein [Burkholderia ubonensis]KVL00924.1 hypothetical protein WJ45_14550 [Burkholderia ubonensis]KVQ50409.1 hypothetical protein WK04_05535 [Burkholderia ubonensis]
MSLTQLLVPTFTQFLRGLSSWIDKAAAHRQAIDAEPDALLAVRQEGWNANAQPGTWSDAKARIDDALALLDGLSPNALDAGGALPIALELPNGVVFDMTGEQYARDWALPQFYFHVVTAYAILRNQGVELGKADYVSYMLAYLRPGTMPQG